MIVVDEMDMRSTYTTVAINWSIAVDVLGTPALAHGKTQSPKNSLWSFVFELLCKASLLSLKNLNP